MKTYDLLTAGGGVEKDENLGGGRWSWKLAEPVVLKRQHTGGRIIVTSFEADDGAQVSAVVTAEGARITDLGKFEILTKPKPVVPY